MAWYPGQDGGKALGELLFGDKGFSGKLPVTWPKQLSDEPQLSQGSTTPMDYFIGYSYFDHNNIAPLFAFGYGMSYASFKYQYLTLPCSDVTKGGVVDITVDITNTADPMVDKRASDDETAFLFVSYPNTTQRRPKKELKSFARASIPVGQTARVHLPLRISDLKYWDTASSSWQIESGPVQVMVGPSSDNLMLTDMLTVK
jgi:beta-glucosidase